MAFRSTPGAIVVGSTTAGADGNVSQTVCPAAYNDDQRSRRVLSRQSRLNASGLFRTSRSPDHRRNPRRPR